MSEFLLYKTEDGQVEVDVIMDQETVWLTANKMALLFGRDEKTIRKHINNVFSEGELVKENNTQKMRVDGVKQPVQFYNLDVIISVGYRVKSLRGTQFRQWATKIFVSGNTLQLKDYSKTDWLWSYFDQEEKQRRHETVFPEECRQAYEKGAALITGLYP